MKRFVPLLLLGCEVFATEPHAEAALDANIELGEKTDLILHNRARVRMETNEWYDISLIPFLSYKAHPNLTVFGGSFFTWFSETGSDHDNFIRPFGGVEPALHRESLSLAARTTYERFVGIGEPDFSRYRQRFRIIGNNSWTPYANVEFFWTGEGFASTRYGVGFRRDLGKRNGIEISYWYEARRLADGGLRQVVVLTYHLNFKGLAPDF